MKALQFTSVLLVVTSAIVLNACSSTTLSEEEARRRAEAKFERHCSGTIHYETSEFNPPELHIGTGDGDELCYQYIWKHKSENLEVVFGVSESGAIGGGSGPIDPDKPRPPRRKALNK